jgi:hypothetical protein
MPGTVHVETGAGQDNHQLAPSPGCPRRQAGAVCGETGCPVSSPDHAPYAKRAMAQDMVTVMCSGLQTAARGLANNVAFEPTIRANMRGREPTLFANKPTFRANSLQTAV